MRCNICNAILTEKEIRFNRKLDAFESCTVCLDSALEAAFPGGFNFDTVIEEEVTTEDDEI